MGGIQRLTWRGCLAAVAACAALAAPGYAQEPDYTPDPASLNRHHAPRWFEDAKLGFFIHWGAYSVPAWAPESGGRAYAEWYWNEMSHPGTPTFERHREVYGEDFPYDRFIEQWKAERFDPDAWLRLFKEGGAKYFVQVSKHHDGVALFDTATTGRDTVELGPHRDFVRELFDAAERGHYGLKRGLYYSLPEWFHPNGPATSGTWGQGPPTNPFTGAPVPYTGYRPISSYVDEDDYLTADELIDSFADIVSKNGNLLLNLGPKADGTIPEIQAERVRALGDWLDVNGEAIYGTTYWSHAEDARSNVPVRYTVKDGALYATALEWPGERLTLSGDLPLDQSSTITLLGSDGGALAWRRQGDTVAVDMPAAA